MSSLGLIISIAVPVLLILILVVMLSRLQQKKQAQRGQARAVKIFIEDLADALEFLVKVDNKKEIQNIVFDYNGTIAIDGKLIEGIKKSINEFSNSFNFYVITADTGEDVEAFRKGICDTVRKEIGPIAKPDLIHIFTA